MASPRNLRRNFAVGNSSPSLPGSEIREHRFLAGLRRGSALCVEGQSDQNAHGLFDWNSGIGPMELDDRDRYVRAKPPNCSWCCSNWVAPLEIPRQQDAATLHLVAPRLSCLQFLRFDTPLPWL